MDILLTDPAAIAGGVLQTLEPDGALQDHAWAQGDALIFPSHKSRRAAAGRAELLAKWQHTDRLQNPAKLRRFRIGGG